MGSCYAVELEMKSRDAAKTVEALQRFIRENPANANFSLEAWKAEGVGTEALDDLVKIMLAGWKGQPVTKDEEGNGFVAYSNEFDASYGWEAVMMQMFFAMGGTLCDGSTLRIDCDDGVDVLTVRKGKAVQVR